MATVKRTRGAVDPEKAIRELGALEGQVGWFSSSKYPDGTPVAYVATIQEFGSPAQGIPSRSFQRSTMSEKQDDYGQLMGKGARAVLAGKLSARKMLDSFSQQVAGDMRAKIARGEFKAIADSTKAARARRRGVDVESVNDDPLRDTNVMVNTLNSQVADK